MNATPNRLTVRVTKSHILAGRRSSRCACPVALAIRQQLPGRKVVVQLDKISIDGVPYVTPVSAARFMGTYDTTPDKARVRPTKFSMMKQCRSCDHAEHPPGLCFGINSKGRVCSCNTGPRETGQ